MSQPSLELDYQFIKIIIIISFGDIFDGKIKRNTPLLTVYYEQLELAIAIALTEKKIKKIGKMAIHCKLQHLISVLTDCVYAEHS